MPKKVLQFGKLLKELRINKELTLREICQKVGYDSSNWSKIERSRLSPPDDEKTLVKWGMELGLKKNSRDIRDFIDKALIAQQIIPQDIFNMEDSVKFLPAFFRTIRSEKPTKEDMDELIKIIKDA